jgi:hypothetical protein
MGNGQVVHSDSDEDKWIPVAQESIGQVLWKHACDKEWSHSRKQPSTRQDYEMSDQRATSDSISIEEAIVFNIWEIAAIVEVLERKGLCTKQDLYDIAWFRRKKPRAGIPETTFPEPYLLTETENKIIDDILKLLNKHGLTSHQSMNLLKRLERIIEMGQQVAKETTQ